MPFKKGQSGNPGGKKKGTGSLQMAEKKKEADHVLRDLAFNSLRRMSPEDIDKLYEENKTFLFRKGIEFGMKLLADESMKQVVNPAVKDGITIILNYPLDTHHGGKVIDVKPEIEKTEKQGKLEYKVGVDLA